MKTFLRTSYWLLILFILPCYTQAQKYSSIEYVIGIPMYDLRNYIAKTSFRGIAYEQHSNITSNITAGFSVGWSTFYTRMPYATYRDGTASLSGIQYRYSSAIPIHAGALYFLKEQGGSFNPYVGLSIGTTYTIRDTDMGLYRWEEEAWSFSLRPEIGMLYTLCEDTALKVSIRYNEAFKTEEMDDQSFLAIAIGLVMIK